METNSVCKCYLLMSYEEERWQDWEGYGECIYLAAMMLDVTSNNSPGATPHTNMSAECASHSAAHTREIQRSAYHSIIRAPLDPFCYPEYGLAPILNKHNMIFFLIVFGMQVSLNLAIIKENMLHRLCALFEVWGSDLELESSDSVNNCGVLISQTCVGSG